MAAKLEEEFTVKVVFAAFSDLNRDKGPCLDGFSLDFWYFNRNFVGKEVMGFLKEFLDQEKFVRSLNSMFLALILRRK